jgi:DNA-binding protein H-NS
MSSPTSVDGLMGSLPTPRGDDPSMLRSQAKALGLTVYRAMVPCRVSDRHGYLRLTSTNKCAACVQRSKDLEAGLRATAMDRIKAEVRREIRKELAAEIAEAHKQARDILKEATKEAMDKAKMLEKAQATRAARKAAKRPAEPSPGPVVCLPDEVGTDLDGLDGPDVAPWD